MPREGILGMHMMLRRMHAALGSSNLRKYPYISNSRSLSRNKTRPPLLCFRKCSQPLELRDVYSLKFDDGFLVEVVQREKACQELEG